MPDLPAGWGGVMPLGAWSDQSARSDQICGFMLNIRLIGRRAIVATEPGAWHQAADPAAADRI